MTEVLVKQAALESIVAEVGRAANLAETGGILLGRVEDAAITVEAAGDPGPAAERRPNYFDRDLIHAQRLAAAAWQETRSEWIGEWHTHLVGQRNPSSTDLASYGAVLADPAVGLSQIVSIIAGPIKGSEVRMTAWVIDETQAVQARLVAVA